MYIIPITVVILILAVYSAIAFYGNKWKNYLREYPTFSSKHNRGDHKISFQYADAEDKNLKWLRDKYELDTVAGKGLEIERIVNLMKWVHQLSSHSRNPTSPKELNARKLIDLCQSEKKKLNCWMYSIILNEVYLSMGYVSRMIHLKPYSGEEKESHFVVSVYSSTLEKWIMMDPDNCGYLRDENGNLLNIPEVRQRLIADEPLIVNNDIGGFSKVVGKWSYTWYLSKNVFRYNCQQSSEFGQESHRKNRVYYELLPDGFREELLSKPEITPLGNKFIYINDETLFWQSPI